MYSVSKTILSWYRRDPPQIDPLPEPIMEYGYGEGDTQLQLSVSVPYELDCPITLAYSQRTR